MTTRLLDALADVGQRLTARGQRWALIGGLAVSARAEPRFTRDVDLAVAVDDDATAEALVADLVAGGFTLVLSLEQRALDRLATVRLLPPGESGAGILIDLLFASSGIEAEICRDAEPIELVAGLTVPVATVGHLLALKVLATEPDRPQDAIDIQSLTRVLTLEERARCEEAVRHIEAAKANRGKPLTTILAAMLAANVDRRRGEE